MIHALLFHERCTYDCPLSSATLLHNPCCSMIHALLYCALFFNDPCTIVLHSLMIHALLCSILQWSMHYCALFFNDSCTIVLYSSMIHALLCSILQWPMYYCALFFNDPCTIVLYSSMTHALLCSILQWSMHYCALFFNDPRIIVLYSSMTHELLLHDQVAILPYVCSYYSINKIILKSFFCEKQMKYVAASFILTKLTKSYISLTVHKRKITKLFLEIIVLRVDLKAASDIIIDVRGPGSRLDSVEAATQNDLSLQWSLAPCSPVVREGQCSPQQ